MTENHTATAIAVGAVVFGVVGVVQLLRGLVLVARSRRFGIMDLFEDRPAQTRARGLTAIRTSAVCFAGALVASVLVYVSLH